MPCFTNCEMVKMSIFYCLLYGLIEVELFPVTHSIGINQVICIPVDYMLDWLQKVALLVLTRCVCTR